MSQEEQKRLYVLNQVIEGKLVARKAAALLGRSVRQIRRWICEYRRRGAVALIHGNRGRAPVNRVRKSTINRVVKFARGRYSGFNQQHFSEMLAEREGIALSRSTVRRILEQAGIASPRQRRPPKHRSRRERYSQEGMLVQIDGSPHRWFGSKGPERTLLAAIDDATGKVLGAVFREQEDAQGYFLLMRLIIEKYGCPLAVYRDRHGIFQRRKNPNLAVAEQLEDQPKDNTQFGRLLTELHIESIPAYSPQGKGRIERLFGTFQDRLVSEFRLDGIRDLNEANAMLSQFLPRYNRRFVVPAKQTGTVFRQLDHDLDTIFAFKYWRTVGMDNIVRFHQHRIQIESDRYRSSYARARVQVHQRMDGSLAVYYRDRCLATTDAPAEAPVLRVRESSPPSSFASDRSTASAPLRIRQPRRKSSKRWKPSHDHPWRRHGLKSWQKLTPFPDVP